MINFNSLKYERIDYDETKNRLTKLIEELKNTDNAEKIILLIKQIINIQNHIEEMYDYADIKNMRNSEDVFFNDEINYWNTMKPKFDILFLPFYELIDNQKYKKILNGILPDNFYEIISYQKKTSNEDVVELQKKEFELKKEYRSLNKLLINYNGEDRTISSISGDFSDSNRNIRKKSHDTINDFYYSHKEEYNEILFKLIKVRNEIAKKLGFENYVEYSLYKLKRFGYDYKDISKFRDNVLKYITPLCKIISERQKENLHLEELKYYDTIFFEQMPKINKNDKELLIELKKSIKDIDDDLYQLYTNMLDNNYIDLDQRQNKVNFSITNYLVETKLPVITGNFKHNYLDVKTTMHELGHSFQKYMASFEDENYIVSSLLKYPTMEIAEMFSYAMELISTKYLNNIFSELDFNKYYLMEINSLVNNLPYICLVDEFQETIYSNMNLKVDDIRKTWISLSKKYHLEKQNSGHKNLDDGGYFYRQTHIYTDPFYYIDYALSNFGAISIWNACNDNIHLFKEIGSVASYYSFDVLIKKYNLPNPFDEETVKNISIMLEKELKKKINY